MCHNHTPPYENLLDNPSKIKKLDKNIRDFFMYYPCRTIELLENAARHHELKIMQIVASCQEGAIEEAKKRYKFIKQMCFKKFSELAGQPCTRETIAYLVQESFSKIAKTYKEHVKPEVLEQAAIFFALNIIAHGYNNATEIPYVIPGIGKLYLILYA